MDETAWIIELKDALNVVLESTRKETQYCNWELHSIYELPESLTNQNMNAYKPRIVSFGPYHYGHASLKAMEVHKNRALVRFLKRSGNYIDDYAKKLAQVSKDLKDAYASLDRDNWKHDSKFFMYMMIRDGCFMLDILKDDDEYDQNDPIFSKHGKMYMMPYIRLDMLMLENQLPMLLLTTLLSFEQDIAKKDEEYINRLIMKFMFGYPPHKNKKLGKCKHVLDVYRKSLLWEDPNTYKTKPIFQGISEAGGDDIIPSATDLHESGIVIKTNTTGSLKDISFHRGILSLPPTKLDDTTEPVFLNLMAFERFHVGAGNEVTSYIAFMNDIIHSSRDVNLLHDRNIIHNTLGSDKAVVGLFNSITRFIILDPESKPFIVREKVCQYSKTRWRRWRGNIYRSYFRNPWAIVSLIAANVLFILTIFQTIYTIGQYYRK